MTVTYVRIGIKQSVGLFKTFIGDRRDAWAALRFLGSFFLVGWGWISWYCGHYWPILPAPDDRWWWLWGNWWTEDWQGKPKYSENTCPSATWSTTNPTWLDPGLNSGRRGGKPATNRLSYVVALFLGLVQCGRRGRSIFLMLQQGT
jgi:hypothetical protein